MHVRRILKGHFTPKIPFFSLTCGAGKSSQLFWCVLVIFGDIRWHSRWQKNKFKNKTVLFLLHGDTVSGCSLAENKDRPTHFILSWRSITNNWNRYTFTVKIQIFTPFTLDRKTPPVVFGTLTETTEEECCISDKVA